MRNEALHLISAGLCGMSLVALLMLALINTPQLPPAWPLVALIASAVTNGVVFWRTR
jgi:hypothetical protein